MIPENRKKILETIIRPGNKILDVGGWGNPFSHATHVIDILPYETRKGDRIGECFNEETWAKYDICSRAPWPYEDKEFDFVVCSHVLEDIRDPLWVCSEMNRAAKAGYIETPSRGAESMIGRDRSAPLNKEYSGYWHHRWFVEINAGALVFTFKSPLVLAKGLRINRCVDNGTLSLFWKDNFSFSEHFISDPMQYIEDQVNFIGKNGGNPSDIIDFMKLRFGVILSKKSYIRRLYSVLKQTE